MDSHLMHGAERRLFYQDQNRRPHALPSGCLKTHKSMGKGIREAEPPHTTAGPEWKGDAEGPAREAAQVGKRDLPVLRLPEGWAPFTP